MMRLRLRQLSGWTISRPSHNSPHWIAKSGNRTITARTYRHLARVIRDETLARADALYPSNLDRWDARTPDVSVSLVKAYVPAGGMFRIN